MGKAPLNDGYTQAPKILKYISFAQKLVGRI